MTDRSARQLLQTLLARYRWRMFAFIAISAAVSLLEGSGILLLVPLLHVLVDDGSVLTQSATSPLLQWAQQGFASLGVSLSLPVLLLAFVGLVVLQSLAARQAAVWAQALQFDWVNALRRRAFNALARADWQTVTGMASSEFHHLVTTEARRSGLVIRELGQFTLFFILAPVYLGLGLLISVPATLMALLTGAVLVFVLRRIRSTTNMGRDQSQRGKALQAALHEHTSAAKLVRILGLQEKQVSRFAQASAAETDIQLAFQRAHTRSQAEFKILSAIALAGLVYLGFAVLQLPLAEMLLLVLVFARFMPMTGRILQQYQQWQHTLPAWQAINDFTLHCEAAQEVVSNVRKESTVAWPNLHHSVDLCDLSFRYQHAQSNALNHITLHIPVRQTIALVGASGAGKSTLADVLMGLLRVEEGMFLVDKRALTSSSIKSWRQAIAYVPQQTVIFNGNVRRNVVFDREGYSDEQLWQVLQRAAADDFVRQLPDGLDTELGDNGVRLSGGECQRIALARALLGGPQLLILDEATSSLDSENEQRIQQSLKALHGELTLVIIAHRLSTVRHADNIVVLDAGEIVEQGRWDELAQQANGRLRSMIEADTAL